MLWLIRALVHACIACSFVLWFHSHFDQFVHLFIRESVQSCIGTFVLWFLRALANSYIGSFVHWFIRALVHLCSGSFVYLFIHAIVHLLRVLLYI